MKATSSADMRPSAWSRTAWKALQRPAVIAGVFAYLIAASAIEYQFGGVLDRVLAVVGLRGLGFFLWLFFGLLVVLEWVRVRLREATADTVRALEVGLRLSETSTSPTAEEAELLRRIAREEHEHAAYVPHGGEATAQARCMREPAFLLGLLRQRAARLCDELDAYRETGSDVAAQLGLIGTLVGLTRALQSMTADLKDIGAVGGQALAALGGSQLGTVFSTTLVGAYIIVIILVFSSMLRLRIRSVARQIESTLKVGERGPGREGEVAS